MTSLRQTSPATRNCCRHRHRGFNVTAPPTTIPTFTPRPTGTAPTPKPTPTHTPIPTLIPTHTPNPRIRRPRLTPQRQPRRRRRANVSRPRPCQPCRCPRRLPSRPSAHRRGAESGPGRGQLHHQRQRLHQRLGGQLLRQHLHRRDQRGSAQTPPPAPQLNWWCRFLPLSRWARDSCRWWWSTPTGFRPSNPGFALLQGSAAAGLPSITGLNGNVLAATSIDPDFAVANVETTLLQGSPVVINGTGFDITHGVAVDVFCACHGRQAADQVPRTRQSQPEVQFDHLHPAADDADRTGVDHREQRRRRQLQRQEQRGVGAAGGADHRDQGHQIGKPGSTVTVDGTGFSTLTVINLFNTQARGSVNLGGLKPDGMPQIPLDAGQLDPVHVQGTGGSHGRTGIHTGIQSALPALHQHRQRPLRRVHTEVGGVAVVGEVFCALPLGLRCSSDSSDPCGHRAHCPIWR